MFFTAGKAGAWAPAFRYPAHTKEGENKMEKKEILTIDVQVQGVFELKGTVGEVSMVPFDGTCETEYFRGKVMAGGVDTQMMWYPDPKMISARYMLIGTDCAGKACRIFVENNGAEINGRVEETKPRIITDSEALSWFETARLTGTLTPTDSGVTVRIFAEC